MKTFFYLLLLSTFLFSCTNSGKTNSKEIPSESNKFDAELAKELNADNYGMKL